MKKSFLVVLFSFFFLTSCSLFQKQGYPGPWELSIKGDVDVSYSFTVKEDNTFSFTRSIDVQSGNYDANFQGKISEDGKLKGEVFVQGMKVAEMTGTINFENGSGTWEGGNMRGTWTAVKK